MRIALVAHGFPPLERTGVENHVADLAREFARRGHDVHVFVPRRQPRLSELALRLEARDGYRVHWLARNEPPRSAAAQLEVEGVEQAFAEWLERERPDIVHVHHVAKLGLGVLAAARAAGMPVVFTAHDAFAFCHRVTHLRPDLARCERIGDAQACARCDLAAAELNRHRELGDYHAGMFPADLEPAVRKRLAAALGDDFASRKARTVLDERRALDERRFAAFREVDLVLSPSAFYADELVRAGLARERVVHEPIGIDVAALASVEPARTSGALRLGFVGGTSKHKGLHVLLAALDGLGPRIKLAIWGSTSDLRWEARLRTHAADVDATWHGGFDAGERARVFASFDVLCVPSIWDENAPLVIRESFAAGRPVLASRVGALAESVRDGVDGVLVAPGDVAAWREVLAGWIRDRAPLEALRAGVRAPRTLADEATATLGHYQSLLAARRESVPAPASLVAFRAEHAAIASESFEALTERVARGLERFRAHVGVGGASGFAASVRSSAARDVLDRARDARRERQWLARSLERRKEARDEVARLARAQRELAERFRVEHAALVAERDALATAKSAADLELARLVAHAEELKTEVARAGEAHATATAALAECQDANRRIQELVRVAVIDRQRVGDHVAWLERSLRELARDTGAASDGELADEIAAARVRLADWRGELEWRRAEMRAALDDRIGLFGKGALGERLERWRARPDGADVPGGGTDTHGRLGDVAGAHGAAAPRSDPDATRGDAGAPRGKADATRDSATRDKRGRAR
ncbi:MAG: glycosyltransferase [Planctomycetes bacterium]|nr:glycosyltransferase [Planctomycetota bacterium]